MWVEQPEAINWLAHMSLVWTSTISRDTAATISSTVTRSSSFVDYGDEFDFIHTSPPCQSSSALTKGTNKGRIYPQLIPATRKALKAAGRPCVIENVSGAPIRKDVTLCGEMFGLQVIRHRHFEIHGWQCPRPDHLPHRGRVAGMRHGQWFTGPYFAVYGDGGGKGTVQQWQEAMGIDWTGVRKEIAEAIPPAYTRWILEQFDARPCHQRGRASRLPPRPSGNLSALTHIRSGFHPE